LKFSLAVGVEGGGTERPDSPRQGVWGKRDRGMFPIGSKGARGRCSEISGKNSRPEGSRGKKKSMDEVLGGVRGRVKCGRGRVNKTKDAVGTKEEGRKGGLVQADLRRREGRKWGGKRA